MPAIKLPQAPVMVACDAHLLAIPREIRDRIYSLIIKPETVRGRGKEWTPRGNQFPGDAFPLDAEEAGAIMGWKPPYIPIMLTCSQTHDEVAALLYNTVEIDLTANRDPEKAFFKIGHRYARHMKHMTIEFRPYTYGHPKPHETKVVSLGAWRAAAVLHFLIKAGARLETLTLKAPWHRRACAGNEDPAAHEGCISLEPLLRYPYLFADIRSVLFPQFLALCPSRATRHRPKRNRPMSQAEKDEIARRLGFEVEVETTVENFERTAAPLPKGFFVIRNPREVATVEEHALPVLSKMEEHALPVLSKMEEHALPVLSKMEWHGLFNIHMVQLWRCGFLDGGKLPVVYEDPLDRS